MSETAEITVPIANLSCGGCVARAERAAQGAGVAARVNLATQSAQLQGDADGLRAAADALDQAGYPAGSEAVQLSVSDLSCAGCVGRVERALRAQPGVLEAGVNLASGQAQVRVLSGAASAQKLAELATQAGYPAQVSGREAPGETSSKSTDLGRNLTLAALLTLPVFVLEMGGHVWPAWHHFLHRNFGQQPLWILQAVLTALVMFGPGRVFYAKGLTALWRRAPDMNSLVALGSLAAFSYSLVATFVPHILPANARAVYFESAAVIVTLILMGRWLEARAKGRAGAAIAALTGLRPDTAHVLRDGQLHALPLEQLVIGDLVQLRPGDSVAADGIVSEGESYVDESMMTGEPAPVAKTPGDPVSAGTVNGAGSLRFRVTHLGGQTRLAQIIRMVTDAQGTKLPIQALVDRITYWFVPVVLGLAALTVLVWLAFGPSLAHALVAGVSVLIIACPCAMGLATPVSILVGTGRAAQLGVLFRQGAALQTLASVRALAFDKTGTLTEGRPTLTELTLAPGLDLTRDALLHLLGTVEARSEHPLARAILEAAPKDALPEITEFQSVTGQGVRARVAGQQVVLGSERFLQASGISTEGLSDKASVLARTGHGVVFAGLEGRLAALIGVSDPVKPGAAKALEALRARGMRLALLTGDRPETAHAVAEQLGLDEVTAGASPEEKAQQIAALQEAGPVAFVGDGINDAPALAHADLGIAIGTGTDVAIESADIVLMSGDLAQVDLAFEVSTRTLANIRQNLIWAFGYNAALVPVAAGVLYPGFGLLLSPGLAAGAMALSSVFVLTNALRLRGIGRG